MESLWQVALVAGGVALLAPFLARNRAASKQRRQNIPLKDRDAYRNGQRTGRFVARVMGKAIPK